MEFSESDSSSSNKSNSENGPIPNQRRVGLIYDERMCKHFVPQGEYHPENPYRIRSVWNKLQSAGIHQRCVIVNAKETEDKYIALVHTKKHIDLIKNISSEKMDSRRNRMAAKFNSIYFNEGSSEAAYLAAGSVIEVAEKVAKGELSSAFAIVRPPGHHAEEHQPMGFCLFNNVGIATSYLLNERLELGIKKILIVDWDVHHGNGTQKMFWKDPRVLFFSVHRHEFGSFYPAGDDGSHTMTGEGQGAGYNINVPWENGRCGDADYLAVWEHILIPVAKEYNPDLIIISAGFDAAINDPLGGCCLTPYGYSVMLKKLMEFAGGRIVMALEGGYNLDSIANSVLACVEVLLEDKNIAESSEVYPFESTWRVIQAVREELSAYWPILATKLPEKLTSRKTPQIQILSSDSDGEYDNGPHTLSEDLEEAVRDVIQPLLKLKVDEDNHDDLTSVSPPWRSELSKVDVWYAAFGSNMSKSRFRCYIEGGLDQGVLRDWDVLGSVPTLWPRYNANFPFQLFDAFVRENDDHRFDNHTNENFLDEGMSYLAKANAVFGRLRPRHINAESDEETLRREINMLKATLAREREEHESTFRANEGLQRELAQNKEDLRETHDVLISVREELKMTKANEQKLANMNVRFVAETEALKTTNEELDVANQNLSVQLGEVQTKARSDRKVHRAKRRKLRGKIKALQERDLPLTEEVLKRIQADYRTSDELGAKILKVYYEGYEDCRGRGKEKLTAAQLDPALLDSENEGAA